jgi:hypothetical protein
MIPGVDLDGSDVPVPLRGSGRAGRLENGAAMLIRRRFEDVAFGSAECTE